MTEAMLEFTAEDIEAAIGELKNNSAPGSDGVPAQLLKRCKHVLAAPLDPYGEDLWKLGLFHPFISSLLSPLCTKRRTRLHPAITDQ